MRGTTRANAVGIRESLAHAAWYSDGLLGLPPPHPALRATFPREGGRPFFPTSSPLAGEDRRRRRQMRGTTRPEAVGTSKARPRALDVDGRLARPPSSGPSGHLPPRGGKAVTIAPRIRGGQEKPYRARRANPRENQPDILAVSVFTSDGFGRRDDGRSHRRSGRVIPGRGRTGRGSPACRSSDPRGSA